MSTPKNRSLDDEEMLAISAMAAEIQPVTEVAGGESTPSKTQQMNPLQERLLKILDRRVQAEENQLAKEKAVHAQRVEQFKRNEQDIALRKSNCPHKKQDGRTAFAGQMHSNGRHGLVCQRCRKVVWVPALEGEEEMSQDLMPILDDLGSSAIGMLGRI